MELHSFKRPYHLTRSRRVGRGGKRGKTAGRGTKGQKARAGNKRRPEMRDTIKKIPKLRGHGKNRARTVVSSPRTMALSLQSLNGFQDGSMVNVRAVMKAGLARRVDGKIPPLKILGTGELTRKLTIVGIPISASARKAIEKAGGSIALTPKP